MNGLTRGLTEPVTSLVTYNHPPCVREGGRGLPNTLNNFTTFFSSNSTALFTWGSFLRIRFSQPTGKRLLFSTLQYTYIHRYRHSHSIRLAERLYAATHTKPITTNHTSGRTYITSLFALNWRDHKNSYNYRIQNVKRSGSHSHNTRTHTHIHVRKIATLLKMMAFRQKFTTKCQAHTAKATEQMSFHSR